MAVFSVGGYCFSVAVFVQCGKLYERHEGFNAFPAVEADYDAVDGEKEVVIRLLQSLGDGVKLALVGAGVVGLRLAGHGAYEVGVDAQGEAYHIDGLLYVALPVAALLVGIYLVDYDVVLHVAVGVDVEGAEPYLAGVLRAGEEVEYAPLFLDDARLLPGAVGDALGFEYGIPVFLRHFDVVFERRGVAELRFFGEADKLLDVEPLAAKERGIIWDRIICAVGRGNAADDSEFAAAVAVFEPFAEVAERRGGIEHFDNLAVAESGELSPVGEIEARDFAVGVRRSEAAVTGLLSDKAHYLCALGVQYDYRHGEGKVLEVLAHAEEVACEVVVKQKVLDVGGNGIGSLGGVVLEAGAIAYFGVEHLTGGEGFVRFYQVDDVEGHKVGGTPRHICVGVGEDSRRNLAVFLKYRLRLGESCRGAGVG